ncbi:MAG: BON domain-containing protein [Bacteriovoracaceae bacterium]
MPNHSWMSESNYGGTDKNSAPKEHIQYGETGQNMQEEFGVPDEQLKEQVIQALTDDMHVDATDIKVDVDYGKVTLTGIVSQRSMMKAADECVRNIPGVTELINDLRIQMT